MTRWFVPGRIEVLGKHTDYAGGSTLVAAVDRGVTISIEPGDSGIAVSTDAAPGELSLAAGHDPKLPAGHWGRYAQAVVDRLAANFGDLAPPGSAHFRPAVSQWDEFLLCPHQRDRVGPG